MTGWAVLLTLPLALRTSSIAERHYSSLPSVCSGNVGTLECLVSARMITQSLQAGHSIAFPMLVREEQSTFEVAAQSTLALGWCCGRQAGGTGQRAAGRQAAQSQDMSSDGASYFTNCKGLDSCI